MSEHLIRQQNLTNLYNERGATIARLEAELAGAEDAAMGYAAKSVALQAVVKKAEADLKRWQQIARVRNDRLAATEANLRTAHGQVRKLAAALEVLRAELQHGESSD